MKVPEARAVVIWMVGEEGLNSELVSQMLPVVLRYLAVSFTKEADETKLQILNCAAKVITIGIVGCVVYYWIYGVTILSLASCFKLWESHIFEILGFHPLHSNSGWLQVFVTWAGFENEVFMCDESCPDVFYDVTRLF